MWVLCGLVLPSSEGALEASDEEGTAGALVSETQHSGNEALGLK